MLIVASTRRLRSLGRSMLTNKLLAFVIGVDKLLVSFWGILRPHPGCITANAFRDNMKRLFVYVPMVANGPRSKVIMPLEHDITGIGQDRQPRRVQHGSARKHSAGAAC